MKIRKPRLRLETLEARDVPAVVVPTHHATQYSAAPLGDFSVSDGVAYSAQPGTALAVLDDAPARDVAVEAGVSIQAGSGLAAGLIARYSGPGEQNFYLAEAHGTPGAVTLSIYRNHAGAYTRLASTAVADATGALRFEADGPSFRLLLHGELKVSASDSLLDGAGRAGIRASGPASLSAPRAETLATPDATLGTADAFFASGRLGREYVTEVGDVVAADGQAANATGAALVSLRGVAQKDQVVTGRIDVSSRSGASVGLVARYTGPGESNFYLAEAYADAASPGVRVSIYLKQSGAYRLLSSTTLAGDARGTLRFEAAGASQRVSLDGVLVAASNDGALGGAGSAGFRLGGAAGSATVDDFSVSTPAPPVPPADATLPFSDAFTSGGTLGAMYAEKAGAFRVAGGAATNVTGVAVAVLNGIDQGDMTVMAGVALPFGSGQAVGLLGRYSGDGEGTGYLAEMYAAPGMGGAVAVNIYRRFGGQLLRLATATTKLNGGTLEFALKGSALGLYMDGGLLVSVRDTLLERGSAGLRLSGPSVSAYGFAADASPRDVQVTETTASGGESTRNAVVPGGGPWSQGSPPRGNLAPRPPEHVLRLL